MKLTVGRLLDFINDYEEITDDFEVFIEYPKRYGLLRINGEEIKVDNEYDDSDMIPAHTIGINLLKKRLTIYHHY